MTVAILPARGMPRRSAYVRGADTADHPTACGPTGIATVS